jgi:signal transduction histidine kinase
MSDGRPTAREYERIRRQVEELKAANEKLGHFAYMVSHDLQEPLRKIAAFTDLLEKGLKAGNAADAEYAMDVVRRSSRQARQLVSDLLAYSRSSLRDLDLRPVNLKDVVGDVLSALAGTVAQTSAILSVSTESAEVRADRTQLIQLLLNLVSNSLKYFAPGSEPYVEIATRVDPDGTIRLRVQDRGVGFDMEHVDEIFEPFTRLVSRSEYEGSGMGLAIARTIADRHGWTIGVDSRLGEGTTFEVVFPPQAA